MYSLSSPTEWLHKSCFTIAQSCTLARCEPSLPACLPACLLIASTFTYHMTRSAAKHTLQGTACPFTCVCYFTSLPTMLLSLVLLYQPTRCGTISSIHCTFLLAKAFSTRRSSSSWRHLLYLWGRGASVFPLLVSQHRQVSLSNQIFSFQVELKNLLPTHPKRNRSSSHTNKGAVARACVSK